MVDELISDEIRSPASAISDARRGVSTTCP